LYVYFQPVCHTGGTEQEFSSRFERLEGDTNDASFLVEIAQVCAKGVSFLVSFLENTLRFWVSFLVSIAGGAPVGEDAFVFGWPK